MQHPSAASAALALVDQLIVHGVDRIFCVPGESYLAVLDACYARGLPLTVCRSEGGAAMMADAYGKATGRPGICFVTRGPGAANAFAGVHIARHDSTPMILFIGQVDREVRGREALQEVDYGAMFGGEAKWVAEIDAAPRVNEFVSRAFARACNGRPGPVVLSLPRDMLEERVDVKSWPRYAVVETAPGETEMRAFARLLAAAKRPFFLLGGSRWDEEARQAMHDFAARFAAPVATSYRRLPLFCATDPHYAGDLGLAANPALVKYARESDLFVLVGGRLGEVPSQRYQLLDVPSPRMSFVHVYPDAEEFGRVFAPTLAIHAAPRAFAAALEKLAPPEEIPWRAETARMHESYLAFSAQAEPAADVDLAQVMMWLSENLPDDAIICNGAGNYAAWIHRYYRFRRLATHIAPTSASMGYGIPAAVAMQQLHPERLVVSIAGDGDFLMNGQEFATAVQYGLPIVVVICDNASYGTIRMHQEREYPGRVSGTDLRNPDFAAFARAFGGFGATVERTADFAEAFVAARASKAPAILHLKIDPDRIAPALRLSALRAAASL
jgi:acetolactate synthase I/II/III large subunit